VVYDINLQGKDIKRVKAEFSQLPEVVNISACSHVPGAQYHAFLRLDSPDKTSTVSKLAKTWGNIDPDHQLPDTQGGPDRSRPDFEI
jgi:hypothetical protein